MCRFEQMHSFRVLLEMNLIKSVLILLLTMQSMKGSEWHNF